MRVRLTASDNHVWNLFSSFVFAIINLSCYLPMISQVVVEYKAKSIKIKVTPATLVREVRYKACEHLKLDDNIYVLK